MTNNEEPDMTAGAGFWDDVAERYARKLVLDIGWGTGSLALHLAEAAIQALALRHGVRLR